MPTLTTAAEDIISAGQLDQTYHIGAITHFQTGTHGGDWNTQLKRYVRHIQSIGGGGGGYIRANEGLEPRLLADPKYGVEPVTFRARECMAIPLLNGTPVSAATQRSISYWGFGGMPNGFSIVDGNQFPFVGFKQDYKVVNNVVFNANIWHCMVINDALTSLLDFSTSISTEGAHEFQLVIEGSNNTIYFYIDGVLQTSYAPASNAAPGQQTPYPLGVGTAAGAFNQLWVNGNVGSATFQCNFCYHMSPMTPLVTYEYQDL